MCRSTFYYKSCAQDVTALVMRMVDLARTRVRFGYRRLHELLRREGWKVKRASHTRVPIARPETRNEHLSMDFVADMLDNGPGSGF